MSIHNSISEMLHIVLQLMPCAINQNAELSCLVGVHKRDYTVILLQLQLFYTIDAVLCSIDTVTVDTICDTCLAAQYADYKLTLVYSYSTRVILHQV